MSCRCGPCRVATGETHYCDGTGGALAYEPRATCSRCGPKSAEPPKTAAPPALAAYVDELRMKRDHALAQERREGYTREAIAARQRAEAAYAAAKRAAELAGFDLGSAPRATAAAARALRDEVVGTPEQLRREQINGADRGIPSSRVFSASATPHDASPPAVRPSYSGVPA